MCSVSATNTVNFDVQTVQTIVAESTKKITVAMINALIDGHKQNMSIKGIAEKYINPKLDKELSESDEKTQRVYRKIYDAASEHIHVYSGQFLAPLLLAVAQQTNNSDASRQYLGSFVFNETKETMKKLESQVPAALECKEIWQ